jgi:hypothetical protein
LLAAALVSLSMRARTVSVVIMARNRNTLFEYGDLNFNGLSQKSSGSPSLRRIQQ